MADEDIDSMEDIFAKELERLIAATDELDVAPPEEPESVADAFEIGTAEPAPAPPGPPAEDPGRQARSRRTQQRRRADRRQSARCRHGSRLRRYSLVSGRDRAVGAG